MITVPIFEGRRYELQALPVEPGSLLTQELIAEWLPETGGVYDGRAIDAVVARLERYYQSRGYPGVVPQTTERGGKVIFARHRRVRPDRVFRDPHVAFDSNTLDILNGGNRLRKC